MRLIKMAVLTGLLTLSCSALANAQTWYLVTVNFAGGTDSGRMYVNVTDAESLFTGVWCFNDSVTHTKMILAAALTAMSIKSQATLAQLTDPTGTSGCIVHAVIAGEAP